MSILKSWVFNYEKNTKKISFSSKKFRKRSLFSRFQNILEYASGSILSKRNKNISCLRPQTFTDI